MTRAASATLAFGLICSCATARSEQPAAVPEPVAAPAPAVAPAPKPTTWELTPDADFRAGKPEPLAGSAEFAAPVPVKKVLPNGLTLLVVENHQLPLVAVEVMIRAGTDAERPGQAGLAGLVAAMVREGTKTKSALELAQAREDIGARLSSWSTLDSSRVHLNTLTEALPQGLDLLADVTLAPAFRDGDLERIRRMRLTELEQKKGNLVALADDQLSRLVFGEHHPFGQPSGGTVKTLGALTRADLVAFHKAWYRPNNTVVVLVGDVTPDRAAELIRARFGAWATGAVPKLALPEVPRAPGRTVVLVDKPQATQSQVWVGGPLFAANDRDVVPMQVANRVVGGLFSSRLNMNIREAKGYSYGVFSWLRLTRVTGALMASGGIVAKNTADAVVEFEKELERFTDGEVTDEELLRAKEAYLRSLPSALTTDDAVATAMATLVLQGLPLDFYKTLPARIAAVDHAEVSRVAKAYLHPSQWPVIVVGPSAASQAELQKLNLGPLQLRTDD